MWSRGVVMVVGDSATVVVLPAACKWEPFPDGVVWVWSALGVSVLIKCAVLNAARCAGGFLLCLSVTFSLTRSLVVVGGRGLCGRGVVMVVGDSAAVVVVPAAGKWEPFPDGVVWVWGAFGARVLP